MGRNLLTVSVTLMALADVAWSAQPVTIANPKRAPATVGAEPSELWRIGGESKDPDQLFGLLVDLAVDPLGQVYLLDLQLSEVKVFSSDGRFVRRIGREGEGPGEFHAPRALCILNDGRLCVLQPGPARLSVFTPDGAFAELLPLPADAEAGFQFLRQVRSRGGNLVIEGLSIRTTERQSERVTRIVSIGEDETSEVGYATTSRRFDFAEAVVRESDAGVFLWTVGPSGRVYVRSGFDYAISVFAPGGGVDMVITRDYDHRVRSKEDMQRIRRYFERGGGTRGTKIEIMPYDRDVQWMEVADDGRLWVLSSRGKVDLPAGTLGRFDVYDDGRLVCEVNMSGEGNPARDRYYLHGGRFYVLARYADAFTAWQARVGDTSDARLEDEEPLPMSVLCYELPANVFAKHDK